MTRAAPGQISVAKWSQSKSPNTRYRARQTIRLPDGTSRRIEAYGRRQRDAIEKWPGEGERSGSESSECKHGHRRPAVRTARYREEESRSQGQDPT